MLLSNRMASIPSSPRHSITSIQVLQTPLPSSSSLQYFNMRVTDRLHRYRSIKRQWNEVAAAIQVESLLTTSAELPDILPSIKQYMNEKTSIEIDPLHSLIQTDLIKLRKLIKARQKNLRENIPSNSRLSGDIVSCSHFFFS